MNVFSPQLLRRCFCQGQQRHICEHAEYDPVQCEYGDEHKALTIGCSDTIIFDALNTKKVTLDKTVFKASSALGDNHAGVVFKLGI